MNVPVLSPMLYAAGLKGEVFREPSASGWATPQAVVAVLVVGVATGVGAADDDGVTALPRWMALVFLGWLSWIALVYLIGGKLLRDRETQAAWTSLARAVGFALSPGVVRSLGIVPGLGVLASLVAVVWQLVAMVVVVREVLRFRSYWRAVAVVGFSFVPSVLIVGLINLFLLGL